MDKTKCKHTFENGTVKIDINKKCMTYPPFYYGYCSECQNVFKFIKTDNGFELKTK
jgi:hypothetical protein